MNNVKIFSLLVLFLGILASCSNQEIDQPNEGIKSTENVLTRSNDNSDSPLLDIDAEPFASQVFSLELSEDEKLEIISEFYIQNDTEPNIVITLNSDLTSQQAEINAFSLDDDDVNTYGNNLPQALRIYCNYSTGMSDCFSWYRHCLDHGCCFSSISTSSASSYSGTVWVDC